MLLVFGRPYVGGRNLKKVCGLTLSVLLAMCVGPSNIGAQQKTKQMADEPTKDLISGAWAGGSNLFGRAVFIQARFEKTATGVRGYFSAPAWNASKREVENVRLDLGKLSFEFPSSTLTPFVGTAELQNGVLSGTLRRGDEQGNFHLVRAAQVIPTSLDQFVGSYTKENGEPWLVTWGAFGNLRIMDLNGSGDALLPLSNTTFS